MLITIIAYRKAIVKKKMMGYAKNVDPTFTEGAPGGRILPFFPTV
jgi:hypothetical protein